MNKRLDEIYNSKPFDVISITTSGKADGSALYFESDIDRLYVVKGTTCVLSDVSLIYDSCLFNPMLYISRVLKPYPGGSENDYLFPPVQSHVSLYNRTV